MGRAGKHRWAGSQAAAGAGAESSLGTQQKARQKKSQELKLELDSAYAPRTVWRPHPISLRHLNSIAPCNSETSRNYHILRNKQKGKS